MKNLLMLASLLIPTVAAQAATLTPQSDKEFFSAVLAAQTKVKPLHQKVLENVAAKPVSFALQQDRTVSPQKADYCVGVQQGIGDVNSYWIELHCADGTHMDFEETGWNFSKKKIQESVDRAVAQMSKAMSDKGYTPAPNFKSNDFLFVRSEAIENQNTNYCLVLRQRVDAPIWNSTIGFNYKIDCGDSAVTLLDNADSDNSISGITSYMEKHGYQYAATINPHLADDASAQQLVFRQQ